MLFPLSLLLLVALSVGTASTAAADPMQRKFPATALRGSMVVTAPPEVTLNGEPARLSPGSRIRSQTNMLELSGGIVGQPLTVHYTVDMNAQVKDVWILTPTELAKQPWPKTSEQAARWEFDASTQTWADQ